MALDREDRGNCIRAAAEFVAAQPGGAERTLSLHHRRTDGNCAGCLGALTQWPCTAAVIAGLAKRLAEPVTHPRAERRR